MKRAKIKVGIFFGGISPEHEKHRVSKPGGQPDFFYCSLKIFPEEKEVI